MGLQTVGRSVVGVTAEARMDEMEQEIVELKKDDLLRLTVSVVTSQWFSELPVEKTGKSMGRM